MKISMNMNKDQLKLVVVIILTGVSAGALSLFLHSGIGHIKNILQTDVVFSYTSFLWSAFFASLSLFLTSHFFRDTSGSGIPHVKLSLLALKGKLSKKLPFSKTLTSFLSLVSGLSLGKEGPSVTISAGLAHLYATTFNVSNRLKKTLVTAGASAGLAAAFNTPIAAVVFTLEEIAEDLNTKTLGVIIFTSVIASFTSSTLLGDVSTFQSVHYEFVHKWHLILYLFLGVFMAILGPLWIKLVLTIRSYKLKFPKLKYLYLILIISFVGIASHFSPFVLGDGAELINIVLGGKEFGLTFLIILFVLKFFLSAMSYSTGVSGGLFMPVLFVGAVGGAFFATVITTYYPVEGIELGAFALIGMAAFLVAVIRVPFTAFVMLFEMTRDYEMILPLMAASITAYTISQLLMKGSIYEHISKAEGVIMPEGDDKIVLEELVVENCMIRNVISLDASLTAFKGMERIQNLEFSGFPVVHNDKLIGMISRDVIVLSQEEQDGEQTIGSLSTKDIVTIYPDQSLLLAFDKMKRFHVGRLAVINRFDRHDLIGILTAEDIVSHFGHHIDKQKKEGEEHENIIS